MYFSFRKADCSGSIIIKNLVPIFIKTGAIYNPVNNSHPSFVAINCIKVFLALIEDSFNDLIPYVLAFVLDMEKGMSLIK